MAFAPIAAAAIQIADEWRATRGVHERHDGPLRGHAKNGGLPGKKA